MINIVLERIGVSAEGTMLYLKDATDWSEHVREDYVFFIQPEHQTTSGPTAILDSTIIENVDPAKVLQNDDDVYHNDAVVVHDGIIELTEFEIPITRDGYYTIPSVVVPDEVPTVVGDYGTDRGSLVQLTEEGLVIKTPQELIEDPLFEDWTITRSLVSSRTSIALNEKYTEYFNEYKNHINDLGHNPDLYYLKNQVDFLRSALASMEYAWGLDNYMGSQIVAENLEQLDLI